MTTTKADTLAKIRRYKKRAALARLRGRIVHATQDENFVDTLVRIAEREGYGDEAVLAEEKGLQAAIAQHGRRKIGKGSGGDPSKGTPVDAKGRPVR